MTTDDLVDFLARQAGPADPHPARRRLVGGLAAAFAAASAVVWLVEGFVAPVDWGASATGPKLAYAALVALAALILFHRAGRPGLSPRAGLTALVAVALAAVAVTVVDVLRTPAPDRMAALMGHSALTCPVSILGLSLPALAATLAAMRRLAPVQPRLAGLAAGLLAGGVATLAYTLACTEGALMFVGVWYTLGMLFAGLAGAALGPRLLRW